MRQPKHQDKNENKDDKPNIKGQETTTKGNHKHKKKA